MIENKIVKVSAEDQTMYVIAQGSIVHVLINQKMLVFVLTVSNERNQVPMMNSWQEGNLQVYYSGYWIGNHDNVLPLFMCAIIWRSNDSFFVVQWRFFLGKAFFQMLYSVSIEVWFTWQVSYWVAFSTKSEDQKQ